MFSTYFVASTFSFISHVLFVVQRHNSYMIIQHMKVKYLPMHVCFNEKCVR